MASRSGYGGRDGDGDSYRPSRQRSRSRSPPRFTGNANSRYRDREFGFEHPRHLPPRTRDTEPDRGSRQGGGGAGGGRDSFRPGGRGGRGGPAGGRGGYQGKKPDFKKWVPLPAHDRPILNFDYKEKTPELMEGMVTGGFEIDLSGEDPAEEKIEGVEGSHDDEVKSATGNKIPTPATPAPSAAPATEGAVSVSDVQVLPIGDKLLEVVEGKEFVEVDKKRVDVITMIRQAKKAAADQAKKTDRVAANDDFISLDFGEEKKKEATPESDFSDQGDYRKKRRLNDSTVGAPDSPVDVPGSRPFSHRERLHGPYVSQQPVDDAPPGVGPLSRGQKLGAPPGPSKDVRKALNRKRKNRWGEDVDSDNYNDYQEDDSYDPEALDVGEDEQDLPKSRKRKHHDISRGNRNPDGNVKYEMRAKPGVNPFPWMTGAQDHSRSLKMSMWLHMEIVDFIEYIRPRPYEHAVRRYVIQSLRSLINTLSHDTDVRVFGSFAAELYLPTSDIDLVVISRDYALRDVPKYDTKGFLYRVATAIRNAGIAENGTVTCLTKAKVPLVKYIDAATGLAVDLSFENKSGLVANDTFRNWRDKYACLPILLTLVKQFLAMRGLNEVYQGGVGSFTLTCLIISLIQQLPSVASGEVDPSTNLGVILLEFLELYGKRFKTTRIGIRVDEQNPGYFKKAELQPPPYAKAQDETLLVIQDPNVLDNNISRSSFCVPTVLACFGEAYDALTEQMSNLAARDFDSRKGRTLLGLLIGGDYTEIEDQRERLRRVYIERIGSDQDLRVLKAGDSLPPPPPPPLPPGPPPPSPPPPPSRRNERGRGGGRGGAGGIRRGGGGPGNTRRQAVDLDQYEDAFERMRSNGGGRGGRNGGGGGGSRGGRNNPIALD